MDEHKVKIEKLYEELKTTDKGLIKDEVDKRLSEFGQNILTTRKKFSVIMLFFSQFANFFAILLAAGSFLAFFAEYMRPGEGSLYIGIALLLVVLLNSIFTFLQQYHSEKIMESFRKMMPEDVEVLRDYRHYKTHSKNIVPGDIIFLSEGDKVPADARLIEENAMKVDNSSLTGESEPQLRKTECTHDNILESRNMVFSGTLVQSGDGKALVYSTGMNTQIGKILKLTKDTKKVETPLQKELKHFIKIISGIALFLGISFFIISFFLGHQLIGSLIFAIGIIVANVPEGLLPTVTLCLSIAAKRMAKKNALIKNLESVETLGSTTVICTDKTGTLTENSMEVNTLVLDMQEKNAFDKGLSRLKTFSELLNSMVLCNNSRHEDDKYFGDPTETALLKFSERFTDVKKTFKTHKRVHESPFDSKTKSMISTNKFGRKKFMFMKGAPEVVLKCSSKIFLDGKIRSLTLTQRKKIENHYMKLASRGERVLGFAYKEVKKDKEKEQGFIFIGLAGMLDPLRKEVPDAIKRCKSAGIKVVMITGDHSLTAEAVARKAGMVGEKEATVITGDKIDNLDDDMLRKTVRKDNLIFARATPMHKLRIVKAMQDNNEIVTVTGDGVNDAPALKNADMGISMGLLGTEVAREASNMVLMDDNFATIVNAVEEGRTIFENIKKFIAYILTSNVPEILPFIAFVLLHIPLPLTVVLILCIDLGTDILPAIALGTEKPESDVMARKPRSRDERLLTKQLLFMSYGVVGMVQAAAGFFSYFFVLFNGGWQWGQKLAFDNPLYMKAVTAFFASIIICQIADVLICRTRRQSIFSAGIFKNKLLLIGISTEIFLLAIIAYFPYTQEFFGTAPLSILELSLSIPFAILIIIGDEVRKFFVRKGSKVFIRYFSW